LIEILVSITIASLLLLGIYRFLFQYSRSYLRIVEKAENISEVWQVFRYLSEDLCNSDFPEGKCENWADYLAVNENGSEYTFYRRQNAQLKKVVYRFDKDSGSLKREDGTKSIILLKDRCKSFSLAISHDETTNKAGQPESIRFRVTLEAGRPDPGQRHGPPQCFSTFFFPIFANLKLKSIDNKKYWPLEVASE